MIGICVGQPAKLPNIGYVGYGYNIFYGNPHATGAFDPGFGQVPVFDFTYKNQQTTPDDRWFVPDDVSIPGTATSCSVQGSSVTIKSESDYQTSLSRSVKFNIGLFKASFSASRDYQEVSESTTSESSVFVSTIATCQTYLVNVNAFVHPAYSATFQSHGALLPTTFDPNNAALFWQFFDLVGTHFPTQVVFGSRWGYRFESTSLQWATLQKMSIDVSVAASYAGAINAGVSVTNSNARSMAANFSINTENTSQYSLGLPPPSDGDNNNWEKQAIVSTEMDPLSYDLAEISDLFTPGYTSDAQLNARAKAVSDALAQYCTLHLLPNQKVKTCNAPTPPTPPPPPVGHGVLACGSYNGGPDCFHQWSVIYDGISDVQAQEVALDECAGCHVESSFQQGSCFAMSTSPGYGGGWAYTTDVSKAGAEATSLQQCNSIEQNTCQLVTSGCASAPPSGVKWGAIACDTVCNNYKATPTMGISDRVLAHQMAIQMVGNGATVAIDYYNCGAVVRGSYGWSAASGATPQEATKAAMAGCMSSSPNCALLTYSCIDGAPTISFGPSTRVINMAPNSTQQH